MGVSPMVLLLLALACVVAVQGASISFSGGGSLGIRPGCPLDKLGEVELVHEKHEAPCGDAEDQDEWTKTLGVWEAAGNTWATACGEGCKGVAASIPPNKPFEGEPNTWYQVYGTNLTTFTGNDKGAWTGSLLDIRNGKVVWKKSKLQWFEGFLYLANDGRLLMEDTHIFTEDTADNPMAAGVIGVNAKAGMVGNSEFVQQDSLFAWKDGKLWFINGFFKQLGGALIWQNAVVQSEKAEFQLWGCKNAHIARSQWNLSDTTVNLQGSDLRIWDTTLYMNAGTKFILGGGSRLLLSNIKVVGDGVISEVTGVPDSTGVGPGGVLDAMNADFEIAEGEAEMVLGPAPADTKTNGRRLLVL